MLISFYKISILAITLSEAVYGWYGVINVPIADLLADAAHLENPEVHPERYYTTLAPEAIPQESNKRVHQALYNDIVNVKYTIGHESLVILENTYYVFSAFSKKPSINQFWTLSKNITPLSPYWIKILPIPYSKNNIILTNPWTEPSTQITFSAGTRFARAAEYDTKDCFAIHIPDWNYLLTSSYQTPTISFVPRQLARIDAVASTDQARRSFISLIYEWITTAQPSIVPYVWGGNSLMFTYPDYDLFINKGNNCLVDGCWSRYGQPTPLPGLDCSGLIYLAARIVGLPFFYRTTTTLSRNLSPLSFDDSLQEGDLVWFPGHVMIVGNIDRHEIIESRGYSSGFGKVHIITLNKIFKGVSNYKQLIERFYENRPLELLDAWGNVKKTVSQFKILKLTKHNLLRDDAYSVS
ncbi:MAG TPA: hypothetical protein VHA52_13050 [Candidatus Babeliaceae bacterium]|nr:hypothetical protein [Candidatus Babeliaceae bacterium]